MFAALSGSDYAVGTVVATLITAIFGAVTALSKRRSDKTTADLAQIQQGFKMLTDAKDQSEVWRREAEVRVNTAEERVDQLESEALTLKRRIGELELDAIAKDRRVLALEQTIEFNEQACKESLARHLAKIEAQERKIAELTGRTG